MKYTLFEKLQGFYWRLIPYDNRPMQLWYRLKCKLWNKYTTVKPRYLRDTWCDRCEILPHMMFEILSQFIEQECSPGHVDWEASNHTVVIDGEEKNVRNEMQDLYDWWHKVYNKEYKEVSDILWQEAGIHEPFEFHIPIDKDGNEVGEEEAEYFEWEPQFKTVEDDEIWNKCVHSVNELEIIQDKKLQEMMHRLVNLTPYLWT